MIQSTCVPFCLCLYHGQQNTPGSCCPTPGTWAGPAPSKGPGLVNPQLEASPAWISRHPADLPTQLEIWFRKSLDLNEQLLVGGPQWKYGALVATASSAYQYTSLLCVLLFKDASLTHCC